MVLGATGLVGGHLVDALVSDPGVGRVVTPLRLPAEQWAPSGKVFAAQAPGAGCRVWESEEIAGLGA